jgi:N-acetylglucosaminyldiphosphoundecaprenol N-acetyl-beta-D-mannosaminyltransferase
VGEIIHFDFFGLKLSVFENSQLIQAINDHIGDKRKLICYGYNFGMFPYFRKYPEIAEYANQFDVLVSDGRGYYILAKLLGFPVKSDLSIPFLVNKILVLANEKHYSVLLLGAKEEINKEAADKIRIKYPGLTIFDGHHGYFNEDEEANIVDYINSKKPDILLIGISSPKKERFAYNWRNDLNCSIIIPCGGVIDILAGFKNPTPGIIKKVGFAWLYRFVQEPKRLFRDSILNLANVIFLMIPSLLFSTFVLRKKFSIPKFYNRNFNVPIT